MSKTEDKHSWSFAPRFRRGVFGWRSDPAITRIKEAVAEIKAASRKDPLLAAAGAVLFLRKLSPALQNIDSSSGAIGNAVNRAVAALVPIIAKAPAETPMRRKWLEQLYQAHADDAIPYIESLGDYWGELCATPPLAAEWADRLVGTIETMWSRGREEHGFLGIGTSFRPLRTTPAPGAGSGPASGGLVPQFGMVGRAGGAQGRAQWALWQILQPFGAFRQVRQRRGLRAPRGAGSGDVGHGVVAEREAREAGGW